MPNKLLAAARAFCKTIEERANVEEVQIIQVIFVSLHPKEEIIWKIT